MTARTRTHAAALFLAFLALVPVAVTGAEVLLSAAGRAGLRTLGVSAYPWSLAASSCLLALLTTLLALAAAFPLAWFLERRDFPLRRTLGVLSVVPLLIPPHIHVFAWMRWVGRQGRITAWLQEHFGIEFDVRAAVFGEIHPGAAVFMALAFHPLAVIILRAGLRSLDDSVLEAGRLLRSRRRVLCRIALPLLLPHLAASALIVFIFAVTCYSVPELLDVPVLIRHVFFTFTKQDQLAGVAASAPLVLMGLLACAGLHRVLGRRLAAADAPGGRRERRRSPAAGLACAAIVALTVGAPLLALVLEAQGLEAFGRAFDMLRAEEIRSTLVFAGGTALLLTAISPVVARSLAASGSGRLTALLTAIPVALPAVVAGMAVRRFFSHGADVPVLGTVFYFGIGGVLFAYGLRFLPFTARVVEASLARIPPEVFEAATLVRRPARERWRRVTLPLLGPGLAAAAALSFLLAVTELESTHLVRPPGWGTMSLRIFNLIHFGYDREVAAMSLLVILLALVPPGILMALARGSQRRRARS